MRKKTKNRYGGYGLQVLLLMLVMLVGGITNIQAQSYITDVMILGVSGGLNATNLRNEYTNKGWTVVEQDLNEGTGGYWVHIAYKIKKWIPLPLMGAPTTGRRPTAISTATSTKVLE